MRKIAMVTGAAGGMGRAICAQLLADGFHVIGADVNWGDEKMDSHPAFSAETADLADDAAVASLFARIKAAHGGLDVLVNNAGTCFMSDFPDIPRLPDSSEGHNSRKDDPQPPATMGE